MKRQRCYLCGKTRGRSEAKYCRDCVLRVQGSNWNEMKRKSVAQLRKGGWIK